MKTIDIKGKSYITVNERLKYFRENFKDYSLVSELISNDNGVCIFKAIISNGDSVPVATGFAYEKEGSSFINKTSYIENCETSAWGRALGNFGIGIDTSVASADEVGNAIKQQENGKVKKADGSILAQIKNSKTVEELEDIYGNLTVAEQPLYLDKLGVRKAVLKANAKHN